MPLSRREKLLVVDMMHSEEYRKEWAMEILKCLIARKNYLNETLRITKDLCDSLDRNDRVSAQMLLEMRAKELEGIDGTVRNIQILKEQLDGQSQSEIEALLQGRQIQNQSPEADKILEISSTCRKTLRDIIAIDKRMSRRVAGKDSFYQE